MNIFRIYSNDYNGILMNSDTYKHIAMCMPINDFAYHKAKYIDYNDISFEEPIVTLNITKSNGMEIKILYKSDFKSKSFLSRLM